MRESVVLVIIGVALLLPRAAFAQSTQPSDTDVARMAIIARLEALQNIAVDYDDTIEYFPQKVAIDRTLPNGARLQTLIGKELFAETYSYLNGNALWTSKMSDETIRWYTQRNSIPSILRVALLKENRLEMYDQRPHNDLGGLIEGHSKWPGPLVDVGLGLRAKFPGEAQWMTADRIKGMALSFDELHRVILSEILPNGFVNEYTFSPSVGYALCRSRTVSPSHAYTARFPDEIDADDFRKVGSFMMPYRIVNRLFVPGGKDIFRQEFVVSSFKLDDPGNSDSRYVIKWPKGIIVTDARTGGYVRTTQEDQILTEDVLAGLIRKQEAAHSAYLRGSTTAPSDSVSPSSK